MIASEIPAILVCGDSDRVVPYVENGALLAEKYQKSNVPFVSICKEGCDHHPHGLTDMEPLLAFAQTYYGDIVIDN